MDIIDIEVSSKTLIAIIDFYKKGQILEDEALEEYKKLINREFIELHKNSLPKINEIFLDEH